jgi:hypothetical protein
MNNLASLSFLLKLTRVFIRWLLEWKASFETLGGGTVIHYQFKKTSTNTWMQKQHLVHHFEVYGLLLYHFRNLFPYYPYLFPDFMYLLSKNSIIIQN